MGCTLLWPITAVTPNKEQLGYIKAFGDILEDLTELVGIEIKLISNYVLGNHQKSMKVVCLLCPSSKFVCTCVCWGPHYHIINPNIAMHQPNSIILKSRMNPFITTYFSMHLSALHLFTRLHISLGRWLGRFMPLWNCLIVFEVDIL